jgi:uncharacterized protein YdeI (YjbR/CyaY-like superfamily)
MRLAPAAFLRQEQRMPEDDLPLLTFVDAESLERWLDEQGEASPGAWLRFAKQGAPELTVSKSDAIDCALAYGWVDGQLGRVDAHFFKTRFTPRRPRSAWSQINRQRVERLEEAGRMHPRGRAQVDQAKADGRWAAAYAGQREAATDSDLDAALDAEPAARELFDTLDSANRFAILYRVQQAKTPEKRTAKIAEMVAMLSRGDTIHPRKAKRSR